MEEKEIINRVAASPLVTFDLEELYTPGERAEVDIAGALYEGVILREKDFREFVKTEDWSRYKGKLVAVHCSADAIVPTWAFMLVSAALEPFAGKIIFGTRAALESELYREALAGVEWSRYAAAKVVIKGCSKVDVPVSAYVEATRRLRPLVSSMMYGEPCSTVPLYKKPK